MSTLRGAVLLALATAAMPLFAADVSYSLNGSAPYYWSTEGNWSGNALPGVDDAAIISQSGLNTSPLIVEANTSPSVSNLFFETGMMVVEPGASLTVKNTATVSKSSFEIGRLANVTATVTNYGSIAVNSFDLGNSVAPSGHKGTLSRFDNFGDLTIDWRLGMGWRGTPGIFYNHEGATVTKNRTASTYTFYFCYGGGDSTLINDGTFTDLTASHIRMGMNSSGKAAIILNKSGVFTSNGTLGLGYANNCNGSLTQNDSSRTEFTGSVNLGYGSSAVGAISLNDSAKYESKGGSVNVGAGANSRGYFTLSNESAFVSSAAVYIGAGTGSYGSMEFADTSTATFNGYCSVGAAKLSVGEMHLKDSACVTTRNQLYVCGNEGGCSTGLVTLAGSSILTNMIGALVIGSYSNTCGRMTLSGNSRVVSTSNVYLGHGNDKSGAGAQGFLTLADNASAEFSGKYLHLADIKYTAGTLEMYGNTTLGGSNLFAIGKAQYATGIVTVANNARVDAGEMQVAGAWLSRGLLVVTNAASVACTNMTLCASNTSDGDLYVSGGTVDVTNLTIAAYGTSDGCVVVADEGRLSCTNIAMATADRAVANLTVTNGGFAQSIGIQLGTGTKSFAHLKVADGALLLASNIAVAVNETASTGILEIAAGAIVSNDYIKIGCASTTSRGILKMSGGTLLISGKNPNDPIYLNQRRLDVSAWIRGWGKVAFYDPRASITEWPNARTRCIVHYGQVIADGEGEERDLDFSRFGALSYQNTQANPSGTNGWFAVNKGRLKLPRCLPRKTANYRCSGDCYDLNYANETSTGTTSNRLANTFTCVFQGAALNNFVFSELYAPDRSDIPAGLDALGADRTISVWRIGLFADGPEIDDPVSPETFTSAKIHFRFPNDNLDGLAVMCVYRHDGTANGKWRLVGRAKVRKGWPVVPARVLAPSDANWNLGWFAVVGRVNPFGNTLIVR